MTVIPSRMDPGLPGMPETAMPMPMAIAGRLRLAILAGTLPAGTRVNQDRIAAEHGVSHIPVREALRSLEAEALVTFHPRRGFFVSKMTLEDAVELGEMRAALECLAVSLAIRQVTEPVLAAAQQEIDAAEASRDLVDWSSHNWAFHRVLYAAGRRPRLIETLESLWRTADRYLRVVWQTANWQGLSQIEHRAILAAFRAGDEAEALQLTRHHICHATDAAVALLTVGDRNRSRAEAG